MISRRNFLLIIGTSFLASFASGVSVLFLSGVHYGLNHSLSWILQVFFMTGIPAALIVITTNVAKPDWLQTLVGSIGIAVAVYSTYTWVITAVFSAANSFEVVMGVILYSMIESLVLFFGLLVISFMSEIFG